MFANQPVYIPATYTVRRWFYDLGKTPKEYLNKSVAQIYTPTENGYIRVSILTTSISLDTLQIEYGSTATSYEPYTGTTYTSSLGTTVYGGSLDLTTGVLTVTHGIVQSGSASDYERNNGTQYYLKAAAASGIKSPSAAEATVMSDRFKQVLSGASGVAYLNTGGNIRFNTADSYNTVQDMLDAVGTIQFVYPLATPTTTQLTAEEITTLLGNNVISASSGSVNVIYRADTKMYIDNAIASIV